MTHGSCVRRRFTLLWEFFVQCAQKGYACGCVPRKKHALVEICRCKQIFWNRVCSSRKRRLSCLYQCWSWRCCERRRFLVMFWSTILRKEPTLIWKKRPERQNPRPTTSRPLLLIHSRPQTYVSALSIRWIHISIDQIYLDEISSPQKVDRKSLSVQCFFKIKPLRFSSERP